MKKKYFNRFPFIAQHDTMDCGPACLAMVAKYYGKSYSLSFLRERSFLTREGVSLMGISKAAQDIGLESVAFRSSLADLIAENSCPCILFWRSYHFVVLYKIGISKISKKRYYLIADPGVGKRKLSEREFKESWLNGQDEGILLLLATTPEFFTNDFQSKDGEKFRNYSFKYLSAFKREFFLLIMSLGVGSTINLALPFLTQLIIDKGINYQQVHIVFLILVAQFFIFSGSVIIEIVRNWLVLFIGARVNLTILSDFLNKIVRLPLKFFETKFLNDFYQRILDHTRIEEFLTSQGLTTFFSLLNFSIFLIVLLNYNLVILIVYIVLTIFAIFWSLIFMKKREHLDYVRFKNNSHNQESINELINGIQEIKLNNLEDYKLIKWQQTQINAFRNNQKTLKLTQIQSIGFDYINQIKNITVTFLAAKLVIGGQLTLGEMMSISFIIGQLNSPINQLIIFFKSYQDAKLSFTRLIDIQENSNEEKEDQLCYNKILNQGLILENVSFQYEDDLSPYVLKNINLNIEEGKTTAIVGSSGCGKTTLLKMMLKFYEPTSGVIKVGNINLEDISASDWRKHCGVVMQDTYIFSETIARNIAMSDMQIDDDKLKSALILSNMYDDVNNLPLKQNTIIGSRGNGLSNGQRQRLLIARAIYKNPEYIFLDEATSSLDTKNEKTIYDNINSYFKGKTVVVIAHRLSTIKSADKIVVIDKGEIVEEGNHSGLLQIRGFYYSLIKNQLESNGD